MELLRLPLALLGVVVKVVYGIPAVVLGEIANEGLVVGLGAGLVDNDILLVVRKLEDNVLQLLAAAELQLLVCRDAIGGESNSGERLARVRLASGRHAYPERDYQVSTRRARRGRVLYHCEGISFEILEIRLLMPMRAVDKQRSRSA